MRALWIATSALLLTACATQQPEIDASPSPVPATPSTVATSAAGAPAGALAMPAAGDVTRGTAPDGVPVYVVARSADTVEAFAAIAEVGPDRLGDEIGWCHVNQLFEATTPGRRYDSSGRSLTGVGGLVRYAAEIVGGAVVVGQRGEQVTGTAEKSTSPPCARRALLTPEYPAEVPLATAARGTAQPVRVSAVLTLFASGQGATLCAVGDTSCPHTTGLRLADPLDAERGARSLVSLARTFWVDVRDGKAVDVALGSGAPPDDDVSEEVQFGYLRAVDGEWIQFDRAEILLGAAAVAAAVEDGVAPPANGDHYLRNRNPRLRRYRVDADTEVSLGSGVTRGRGALPTLVARAGPEFSLTLITRNGKLLRVVEELCG